MGLLGIRACCFHELFGHQGVPLGASVPSGLAASVSFFDLQGVLL